MAQTNYTPISLYYSTTASAAPTAGNLVNGELAINITDGKLYYKDNGGVVQLIASKSGASGSVTTVSVVSANGLAGTVANATTTPAITLSTTVTGLLKGNGTAISAAVSGTDYAPATSGTSILYGNGSGGFSSVTIGTGVSFAGGTLSATGTGGTVTSVAQTFTGGIISVSGSPITGSGTLALTVAGTSGGIPYFSSTSAWASSALLAANAIMVGGGAGAAPSTITTGTGVVTALGVNTGSAGAFVVNGGALGTPSSGTVTNLTGTASININGTVGATTPSTGAFTTLTTSGNVTLGDASTDTVTVNGYVGVGVAANSGIGLYSNPSALSGTSQYSGAFDITGTSAATTAIRALWAKARTPAAAVTFARLDGLNITNAVKGAGSTITDQYGLIVDDQTQGTNNYGITSLVSSGSNKWNIYASGTAANYFAGNVGIGTTSPSTKLDVSGTFNVSSGLSTITGGAAFSGTAGPASGASVEITYGAVANTGRVMSYDRTGAAESTLQFRGTPITFLTAATERMRLDSGGRLLVGTTTSINNILSEQDLAVVAAGTGVFPGWSSVAYSGTTATAASILDIKRSRGTTDGSLTVVASNDDLGYLRWWGADGAAFIRAAQISAQVDGTPGTNDMPGRLVFGTTADGASSPTERMRITSAGNVGIGTTTPAVKLAISSTDAILLPKGTTAQQPTGVSGYLRFNTDTSQFEGYNGTAWSSVGGATLSNDTSTASNLYPIFANATSGSATTVYTSNAKLLYKPSTGELQASEVVSTNGLTVMGTTMSSSYTLATGNNAMTVGPFTVASGVTFTISSGQRHVVI